MKTDAPACLEQPRNSYMWHDRRLRHVLARGHVIYIDVDQCAFGRPWKKTTKLAFICCRDADFGKLSTARCGGRGGWCTDNKANHVQLSGTREWSEWRRPSRDRPTRRHSSKPLSSR